MNDPIPFTFYGDLLGISSSYDLDTQLGYNMLNKFYNIAFTAFKDYLNNTAEAEVFMFSDSILFYGRDAIPALKKLQDLYLSLMKSNLFLRGAIVMGELKFDKRFTLRNFQKSLPIDDKLSLAVSLQKLYKGSRLIVEITLAKKLLEKTPEWLTQEGYYSNVNGMFHVENMELLRRISPTPDNRGYEFLYFWNLNNNANNNLMHLKSQLKYLKEMMDNEISLHYRETESLMRRSVCRKELSNPIPRTG
ncbi:MAG: hypothetical protein AB9882_09510 [Ignavibacteriaceae bacterium]